LITRGQLILFAGTAAGAIYFGIQAADAEGRVATTDLIISAAGLIIIVWAIFIYVVSIRRSATKTLHLSANRDTVSQWADVALHELPQGPSKIYKNRGLLETGRVGLRAGGPGIHDRHAITVVMRASRNGTKVRLISSRPLRAGRDATKDREYVEALASELMKMDHTSDR